MSEEIRLVQIEMKNYRQYYGTNKINFAEREQGFTVIFGKNGEGKSNLLNAINWCLYEIEPHGISDKKERREKENQNLKLPIVNNRYIQETKDGSKAEVKVDVWIKKGSTIYSITRILGIEKIKLETKKMSNGHEEVLVYRDEQTGEILPKGCIRMGEPHSKLEVRKKSDNDLDFRYLDPKEDGTPVQAIKELLPRELSKFFLLDGEFLESFWKDKENIRIGIEQISQLHYLSHSSQCIERSKPRGSGISKDIDDYNLQESIQDNFLNSVDERKKFLYSNEERVKIDPDEETKYYYASGIPRSKQIEEDINKVETKMEELTAELVNSGGDVQPILRENFSKKSGELEKKDTAVITQRRNLIFNLINFGPQIMLKSSIDTSVKMINDRIELGDLPRKSKRMLADYLLKRGRCLCEEKLGEGHERTKHIEEFLKDMNDTEDLDELQKMAWDYKKGFLDRLNDFSNENFVEPRKAYVKLREEFSDLENEVAELKEKLGIANKSKGTEILSRITYFKSKFKDLQQMKEKTQSENRIANEEKSKIINKKNGAMTKNKRAERVLFQINIWQRTQDIFKKILDDLKEDIRSEVESNLWENWTSLLSNNSEFKSLTIEEDYSPKILDGFGFNKALNLSAGQSLLLTLSFVAAIREPTGFKFPLVIDSPSGKIDGPNTHNLGTKLPEFLPEAQITLLATNKEYTDYISPDPDFPNLPKTPVCELFQEKIDVQHFKIQKEKDPDNPNVGNSQIVPAKLIHTNESENREGWMVVADE